MDARAMRLSLCMIVRDSAETIETCLRSIRPWVDELVVVDTGSLDDTPQIVTRLAARLYRFRWCDSFAEARNVCLQYARGEWIFWMDSDDTIDPVNGRKLRQLAETAAAASVLGYVLQVHCPALSVDGDTDVTVVDHVKLFRNLHDLRFEGRIHEQILPAIRRRGGQLGWTDIFVMHSGADHTPEGIRRKQKRDLRLLELELQDQPDHPFALFNLGMTYADMGEHDKAVDALSRSILVSGHYESHIRKAYALLIGSLTELERINAAWQVCQKGRQQLYLQDVELLFRQGIVAHRLGRLDEAAQAYEQVLASNEEPHFASIDEAIKGYKTHNNLALVYRAMGRVQDAELQWRLAVERAPLYRQGWRSLGECLVQQEKHDAADMLATKMLSNETLHREGVLLKVQLAEAQGSLDDAVRHLDGLLRKKPDDKEALETLCRILFCQGDYPAAQEALLRLTILDPQNPAAHQNLGTTYLQTGNFQAAERSYRKCVELRPNSATALCYLGHALQGLGRTAEAVALWRAAQRLAPDDPTIRDVLEHAEAQGLTSCAR